MRVTSLFATAAFVAGVACVTNASEFYLLDPLAGFTEDISDNGVAVGSFNNAAEQYFMWTVNMGAVNIGGVPAGNGVGGEAEISSDGLFICGTTYNAVMDYHEASRYDVTTGVWTGFGLLPGIGVQVDVEVSSGWGISGDGQSVVGLAWTSLGTFDTHAFRWTPSTGYIDLGTATVGESARADAANYDGSVVAGWQDGNGRQGAVWVDGVQELIWQAPGQPAWEAYAVSDDGQWVTGLGIGGFFDPGYSYRYNTVTDTYESLPNLAVGSGRYMAGKGITADGTMIVGGTWGFGPATLGIAFIWVEGVGTMRLDEYFDSIGVTYPNGYNFNFVSGISSNGEWMTGWGGTGLAASGSWVVHIPQPVLLPLDIKPGSCPNPINRGSNGVFLAAVLGTADYDVMDIDTTTLVLARADSPGASVAPLHVTYGDVSTPYDGPGVCGCNSAGGDGYLDLKMKFSTPEVVDALGLSTLMHGDVVELVVNGSFLDGTPFEAFDCITIRGKNLEHKDPIRK